MKHFWSFIIILLLSPTIACSKSNEVNQSAPGFKLSIPENKAVNVNPSTVVEIVFDEDVKLASNHGININNAPANVKASFAKLQFTLDLNYNTTYNIIIPKGAVVNTIGIPSSNNIQLSFTTENKPNVGTSMEFVANMGVGWNLGNSLDSKGDVETAWGNPKATQELINAISDKGFKTLRIPITWQYHLGGAPDYTIEKKWLDRVEEIVNYGLAKDMYVIVNIHHDEEWVIPSYAKLDTAKDQLGKVWVR